MSNTSNYLARNGLVEVEITSDMVLTDTQVNEAWIDAECYEAARLALHRSLGLPEPELFVDESEKEENEDLLGPREEEDMEKKLNSLVDLQERMAKGMKLIQECNRVLDAAATGQRLPYDAYCAWVDRRKKFWAQWKSLQSQCMDLVGSDNWLWVKYFELKESTTDRAGYSEDVSMESVYAYDEQKMWHLESEDCVEE